MSKISIIGAGNVGGLSALRILSEGLGEVVLLDKLKNIAQAKVLDLKDSQAIMQQQYSLLATDDIAQIKDSQVVVITAGLTRSPEMTREELLMKNAQIVKEIALGIKQYSPQAVVIVVTNPLDILTYLVLKITGFSPVKVFGMGTSLDTSRYTNLIAEELNVKIEDIQALVIGSHGEGMLPLARLAKVKGKPLRQFMDEAKIKLLNERVLKRGLEIVTLLKSGSAYFAPSAAIAELVRIVLKDERLIRPVSCYCNGEYGLEDICIGLPCSLGKAGIEKIIPLELDESEIAFLKKSGEAIAAHIRTVKEFMHAYI